MPLCPISCVLAQYSCTSNQPWMLLPTYHIAGNHHARPAAGASISSISMCANHDRCATSAAAGQGVEGTLPDGVLSSARRPPSRQKYTHDDFVMYAQSQAPSSRTDIKDRLQPSAQQLMGHLSTASIDVRSKARPHMTACCRPSTTCTLTPDAASEIQDRSPHMQSNAHA